MVDRDDALEQIPETHALVLRLRDEGLDGVAIAKRLGIPPESVDPLLRIAEAKLARLREETGRSKVRRGC